MLNLLLRTADVIFSILGIAFLSPVILIVTVFGLFDTGSPLFLQERVGRNKKTFTLIKFRTMAVDTQSVGTHLVSATAVTKFGSILRKSKLDELPQLINVLMGDMSLVGYRPCLPNQHQLINEREARHIFDSRPGITGLAQVNDVDMSTPRKLARYDALMIKNLELSLYLKLIFSTVSGKGRGDRVNKAKVMA